MEREPWRGGLVSGRPSRNSPHKWKVEIATITQTTYRPQPLTAIMAEFSAATANSTPVVFKESPLKEVQIEALVVMRIIKHSTSTFPTPSTGFLVGMDVNSQLQITNSFPFPTAAPDAAAAADPYHQQDSVALAAAAPRARSNVAYQAEMIKFLREVNVDAQGVGWYISASMGNFVNQNFIENQAFFQRATDERTVSLVFDVSKTSQGSLSLKAYRLSPSFLAAFSEGKFSSERYDTEM